MFRLSGSLIVLLAGACLLSTGRATAQIKVAILNTQQALLDTAEIKKAQADLEAKFKPRQEEVARIQKELEDIQRQLQTLGDKLTQEAQADLNIQGQRKQRELRRLGEDLQADVDRERNGILGKSSQRMQEIVSKIAEEKGLDVVIDVSNTVYFKPALDITKEVTSAYDKAYPVS